LWKVEGSELKPVKVQLGMTDGASTAVISDELSEGDRIAAAATQQPGGAQRKNSTSPFTGQGGGGGRRGRF
jgi:hypothetical protein